MRASPKCCSDRSERPARPAKKSKRMDGPQHDIPRPLPACKTSADCVRRPVRSAGRCRAPRDRMSSRDRRCTDNQDGICRPANTREATWRSGDAADCKSVNAGSIPAVASKRASTCRHRAPLRALKKIELSPRQRRHLLLCGALSGLSPVFRGSSVVERPTVNRMVVGSNPTRGASTQSSIDAR